MKRTATILLSLSIVSEVLCFLAAVIILFVSCTSRGGRHVFTYFDEAWWPIAYQSVRVLLPICVSVISAIILLILTVLKKKSILPIIIVSIACLVITALLTTGTDAIYLMFTASRRISLSVAEYSHNINMCMASASVLHLIPTILVPVAAVFGIAHKKYVQQ